MSHSRDACAVTWATLPVNNGKYASGLPEISSRSMVPRSNRRDDTRPIPPVDTSPLAISVAEAQGLRAFSDDSPHPKAESRCRSRLLGLPCEQYSLDCPRSLAQLPGDHPHLRLRRLHPATYPRPRRRRPRHPAEMATAAPGDRKLRLDQRGSTDSSRGQRDDGLLPRRSEEGPHDGSP